MGLTRKIDPWAEAASWNIAGFAVFGVVAWWLGRRLRIATVTP